MNAIIYIFCIISSITSIATLTYVIVDIILEKRSEKHERIVIVQPEPIVEPEPIIEPEPEPEPIPEPIVLPEPVEEIDAEEADELLSDEVALEATLVEYGAGVGPKGEINIGVLDQHFEAGDVITLAELKARKLVPKKVGRIKILADGRLHKAFTVKAEAYSVQAIKMIELTGGTVIFLKKDPNESK